MKTGVLIDYCNVAGSLSSLKSSDPLWNSVTEIFDPDFLCRCICDSHGQELDLKKSRLFISYIESRQIGLDGMIPRDREVWHYVKRKLNKDSVEIGVESFRRKKTSYNGYVEKGVDVALTISAMKFLGDPETDFLWIYSQDRDFLPLVKEFHDNQKGIGFAFTQKIPDDRLEQFHRWNVPVMRSHPDWFKKLRSKSANKG